MTVEAELVGGPRDGQVSELHAAIPALHVHQKVGTVIQVGGVQKFVADHREHIYRLRDVRDQLGQSSGHVFYDYYGRRLPT